MVENFSTYFQSGALGFAETITLAGASVSAIVDEQTDLVVGEVLQRAVTVLLPKTAAPAAAEGQTCAVRGVAHVVRQVLGEPPDGALVRLVLARS